MPIIHVRMMRPRLNWKRNGLFAAACFFASVGIKSLFQRDYMDAAGCAMLASVYFALVLKNVTNVADPLAESLADLQSVMPADTPNDPQGP
jgi:hypothetical protein